MTEDRNPPDRSSRPAPRYRYVGGLVETLDPGTDEFPFVGQLFEQSGDTLLGRAEVVRNPAGRGDAERAYRLESQRPPHLLFVRSEGVFPVWQRVRQHALAQVVDAVEVLAAGDHEPPRRTGAPAPASRASTPTSLRPSRRCANSAARTGPFSLMCSITCSISS